MFETLTVEVRKGRKGTQKGREEKDGAKQKRDKDPSIGQMRKNRLSRIDHVAKTKTIKN